MSLSDNYTPNTNAGNGVTTVFTGSWSPLAASYMKVALQTISTGVIAAPLTQGGGAGEYTLTFTSSGYSVTLGTAPSSLYNVIRYREVAIDQTTPYTTAKGFQGLVTENSFDKITAVAQDLRDDIDRAVTFQLGSTSTATLPEPSADKILGWNADGTDLENKTAADFDAVVLGTGVETALGVNVGSAGAFVVNGGALGTPSSGVATNLTGLPISTGVSGLGTGVAAFLATPSSANLATALTNETGTGVVVFGTSPTIATPTITGFSVASTENRGVGIATVFTNNTTYGDINAMTWALDVGSYDLKFSTRVDQLAAGGNKLQIVFSGTQTAFQATYVLWNVGTTTPLDMNTVSSPGALSSSTTGTTNFWQVDVKITVSVAGTLKFQGAQQASNASGTSFTFPTATCKLMS